VEKDQVEGSFRQAEGTAKQAAGRFAGDAKLQAEGMADQTAGAARSAVGDAKEAARDAGATPQSEAKHLRQELDGISAEIAAAEAKAARQARHIDTTLDRRTEAVSSLVRDHPLIAVGGAALAGFLLGRILTGDTYTYRR
jgi:uncharacterized protein YjbJ (UPF0337 family)